MDKFIKPSNSESQPDAKIMATNQFSYANYGCSVRKRIVINLVEKLMGRGSLSRYYQQLNERLKAGEPFWQGALNTLQISLDYNQQSLQDAMIDGPLVVIANHPYGVIDGLAICQMVSECRPNFKIILAESLCHDERIADYVLPISFKETKAAQKLNIQTKRSAIETLQAGGTVIIFPAGGVSTTQRWFSRTANDLDWKPFAAKLIQKTQASVLPVYFHGQNSRLFQIISHFSLSLRLGLYVHEVNKRVGSTLRADIGEIIPYRELAQFSETKTMLSYLREYIYELPKRYTAQ